MMIPCAWNLVAFFDAGKWVDLKNVQITLQLKILVLF